MEILQLSLFPRTEDFSGKDFESFLSVSIFESIVANAISEAFDYVSSQPISISRVKSDVMNERVFAILVNNLLEKGLLCESELQMNYSGNARNCFKYGKYIFIVAKEGGSQNDTRVSDNIKNQSCDSDIIQIKYSIDPTWSQLCSMRFVYSYAGNEKYSRDIYLQTSSESTNTIVCQTEVQPAKITLKAGMKRKVANE